MCPRKQLSSTNSYLVNLIHQMKRKSREYDVKIWRKAADKLAKPKRNRINVNISKLDRNTQENEEILVPGKVLGSGSIKHSLKVAALDFSDQARQKIVNVKGKCFTIEQFMKTNPEGKKVRIIG